VNSTGNVVHYIMAFTVSSFVQIVVFWVATGAISEVITSVSEKLLLWSSR